MQEGQHNGKPRLIFESIDELSALQGVTKAFSASASELGFSEIASEAIDDTSRIILDALSTALSVRAQTRIDASSTFAFGDPYRTIILAALSTYHQEPELLSEHMSAGEQLAAQVYFPETAEPTK